VSTIWDPILDPAFQGRALFAEPSEADGYLELLGPTSRMYFLAHGIGESLSRALRRGTDVLLLNAYWYKYHATEVAHGGDREVLRAITSVLPEPHVTFYLRVTPAEAARRKESFSAYETGFADTRSAEAFESFQPAALEELDALAEELGWVPLPERTPTQELTDLIVSHLERSHLIPPGGGASSDTLERWRELHAL
jgi:dTMP kinase